MTWYQDLPCKSSRRGSEVMKPTSIHEDIGSIPGLDQQVQYPALQLCVGHRCISDLALLWLWCRPAAASLIWPLAWELSYAASSKKTKKKKKKKKKDLFCSMQKFLGLGWKPAPQQQPEPQQRHHQVLNLLCHQETPVVVVLIKGYWSSLVA